MEKILVINKNGQTYAIGDSRFNYVYDQSNAINTNCFINRMITDSNGIIRIQDQSDYPLQSKLICFYDNESKAIKYFDYYDGLVYSIEDVVIYNGAFFYKNTSFSVQNKEFAIWDKMHSSMQYHDDLPKIYFNRHTGDKFVADYIYDSSYIYILTYFVPTIDQIKIGVQGIACIDYNQTLVNYVDSSLSGTFIEEKLMDFSGIFPSGFYLLERQNKSADTLSTARHVKITVDCTFDFPNFITLDTSNITHNPFGLAEFYMQSAKTISELRTYGHFYYLQDDTSQYGYFNQKISPTLEWDSQWNNSFVSAPALIGSSWLNSDSVQIETYSNPVNDRDNYAIVWFNLLSSRSSAFSNAPQLYQKMYHGTVSGTIRIRYRPDVYSIVTSGIQYKLPVINETTYSDCTYSHFKMKFMPLDYLRIRYHRRFISDRSSQSGGSDGTNLMNYYVNHFADQQKYDTTWNQQFLAFTEDNPDNTAPGNIFVNVGASRSSIGPVFSNNDITNALYVGGMDSKYTDTFAEYTVVKQRGSVIEESDTSLFYFAIDGSAEILEEGHNSWSKVSVTIPKRGIGICIRNVVPETKYSAPCISIESDFTDEQLIKSTIDVRCKT